MTKKKSCVSCNKEKCKCTSAKSICYADGCNEIIDTKCIKYKPKGGTSYITCFLGLASTSTLEEILDTLDYKLCNSFTISNIEATTASALGLTSRESSISTMLLKLSEYVLSKSDQYVKASINDTTPSYLFNKITTGDCLQKRITGSLGNETVEVYIDFNCLRTRLVL